MEVTPMASTIKIRADSESNWAAKNPTLKAKEIAYAILSSGAMKWKVGDGVTAWNDLEYKQAGAAVYSGTATDTEIASMLKPGDLYIREG